MTNLDNELRQQKAFEQLSVDVLALRQIVAQRDAMIDNLIEQNDTLTWEHEARFVELTECRVLIRQVLRQQGVMNVEQWKKIEVEAKKESGEVKPETQSRVYYIRFISRCGSVNTDSWCIRRTANDMDSVDGLQLEIKAIASEHKGDIVITFWKELKESGEVTR